MAETIKSTYSVYNGTDYDTHHFETETGQVKHEHADGTESNLEDDLKGALIFIGYVKQTVTPSSQIPARSQGDRITTTASLLTGTDYFVTIPSEGGWLMCNGCTFSQSAKTFSFYPINASDSALAGAYRFIHLCFKRI